MKKLFTLLVILALTVSVFAQVSQKMSYQAVIRNSSGQLVASHAVGMRISILQGTATGTPVYVETHKPTTNANGLATIEIGGGTIVSGTFTGINWAAGAYFLKTETDPNGGNSYTITGISQLLSIPFALYSNISGDLKLPYYGQVTGSLDSAFAVKNWSATGKSTAIQGEGINIGVKGKALGKVGRAVYGEAISSGSIGVYGKALFSNSTGVFGEGFNQGVYGISAEVTGKGVYGMASSTTGGNYGGYFVSNSPEGRGVYGKATATSGQTMGGAFISESTGGVGVFGNATATTGTTSGGYFQNSSSAGRGVFGYALALSGETYGGKFESQSTGGRGVFGAASATSGTTYGGYFISGSSEGKGVFGLAFATSGTTYGGYFHNESTSGRGVMGIAFANTGTNFGGFFQSYSSSGYGVIGHSKKFAVYGKSSGIQGRAVTGEATGTNSIGVHGIALEENSTGVWGEGANYDFYANGPGTNYGSSSSVRWKENIKSIANPLEMIKKLRGVYFDWNAEHGGLHDIGFIAEEVGKVLPEIVVYEENGIDASGLDYSKITPLLLEAIKEQQKQIDELKTIVNQLVSNQSLQADK